MNRKAAWVLLTLGGALASTIASAGVGMWTTNGPPNQPYVISGPVVVDPFAPGTLYSTGSGGLAKSTDDGRTWTVTSQPAQIPGTFAFFGTPLAAGPVGTVYATAYWEAAS